MRLQGKQVVGIDISKNKFDATICIVNDKGRYSFKYAQMCVDVRKERYSNPRKFNNEIKNRINELLELHWSPDQIAGYCRKQNLKMVSREMIYRYIREDKQRGGILYKYCRHRLKHRKLPVGGSSPIKDRVSIDHRPKEADGTRFGDWEMDLIVGKGNKDAMLTLVERSTGYSIIEQLPYGKRAKELSKVVVRALFPYRESIKTITTDNGSEFTDHKTMARRLKTQIYFAHPYSSWEKGLIEYTNKLYRQYIPKDSKFADYSSHKIKEIQYELNNRPRKKLNYATPKEMFFLSLI